MTAPKFVPTVIVDGNRIVPTRTLTENDGYSQTVVTVEYPRWHGRLATVIDRKGRSYHGTVDLRAAGSRITVLGDLGSITVALEGDAVGLGKDSPGAAFGPDVAYFLLHA